MYIYVAMVLKVAVCFVFVVRWQNEFLAAIFVDF